MAKNNRKRIYISLAVLTLLVFLHITKIILPIEQKIVSTFLNVQGSVFSKSTTLGYSVVNYKEAKELLEENQRLEDLVNELLYKNAQLDDLQVENDNLRALLQYQEVKKNEMIVSKVVGRDITRQNTLIINKGTHNGIVNDAPVIVGNGVLVGKVIDVKEFTSTILLLTDQELKIAVSLPGKEDSVGVASGVFGLSVGVELIPQNIDISENDTIITSGLEGLMPRGLVIGQVNRVVKQDGELFKSATVNTIINYDQITLVSVLKEQVQ